VLTVGSGEPRRLAACSLGEPGLIVSGIQEDGYLRVVPAGAGLTGPLWMQSHEGQTVVIGGARGWTPGVVVLPSVHLQQGRGGGRERPFSVDDVYIDVGAENAAEVTEAGIRLLDPVALIRRPSRLAGGLVAAPQAAVKGSCVALADAARRYRGTGTVVFAWTVHDGLNGTGLLHLVRGQGPFQEALLLDAGFGWEAAENGPPVPKPLPEPGSGPLSSQAPHFRPGGMGGALDWGSARVSYLGLPSRYTGTPVETIAFSDVKRLADTLVEKLGGRSTGDSTIPPLSTQPALFEIKISHEEAAGVLSALVARYGVSGAEAPVREEILRRLPSWAKPETDDKGNIIVKAGNGGSPILFMAHMDEVGFRVAEVLPDGRLRLETRGGLIPSVWEAQAALVHGERGSVPGVFEPREDWRTATQSVLSKPLTAWLGVSSAREAETLGIRAGATVTMPKRMFRIGRHRVTARGFDDRVGSAALLLALRRIDPARLRRPLIFAWTVEEEVGLNGARALAERWKDLAAVHPIDTFVSADSPIESHRFAYAHPGQGPVLRAMDNGYLASRELIDRILALADRQGIQVQVGFTGGATDGMPFLTGAPAMLPFGWPGRYSHSPVEVADLRDLEMLVQLILAVASE
jgi:putative aminopeptidase